jgi:hypothetical protein
LPVEVESKLRAELEKKISALRAAEKGREVCNDLQDTSSLDFSISRLYLYPHLNLLVWLVAH